MKLTIRMLSLALGLLLFPAAISPAALAESAGTQTEFDRMKARYLAETLASPCDTAQEIAKRGALLESAAATFSALQQDSTDAVYFGYGNPAYTQAEAYQLVRSAVTASGNNVSPRLRATFAALHTLAVACRYLDPADATEAAVRQTYLSTIADRLASLSPLYDVSLFYAYYTGEAGRTAAETEEFYAQQSALFYGESNWWDWEIGSPKAIGETLLLLEAELGTALVDAYTEKMAGFCANLRASCKTGTNRVWYCKCVLLRALLDRDADAMQRAVSGLFTGAVFGTSAQRDVTPDEDWTEREGFAADGSFIMHKDIAYTGGYGVSLLNDVVPILRVTDGTSYMAGVACPYRSILQTWVFESFAPILHNGLVMDTVRGREIARYSKEDRVVGASLINALSKCVGLMDAAHAAELKSLIKTNIQRGPYADILSSAQISIVNVDVIADILADGSVPLMPDGSLLKHFSAMARTVQKTGSYALAIGMFSPTIRNFEKTNGENIHGWYTGYGMTSLYNGDLAQYSDGFWATVDPLHLPGTTAPEVNGHPSKILNAGGLAGGVSGRGGQGTAALKIVQTDGGAFTAKKSWFLFDELYYAVGSGISGNQGSATTIENRKVGGEASFYINNAQAADGLHPQVSTAYLDTGNADTSIGYCFPTAASLTASLGDRSGRWSEINTYANYQSDYAQSLLTRRYFKLYQQHASSGTGSYAYAVLPGVSRSGLESYAASPDVTVVAQSDAVHAVFRKSTETLGANFWQGGALPLCGAADYMTSDAPCSVWLEKEGDTAVLSIADLRHGESQTLLLTLREPGVAVLSCSDAIEVVQLFPKVVLKLHTGGLFGETVRLTYRLRSQRLEAEQLVSSASPAMTVSDRADALCSAGAFRYAASTDAQAEKSIAYSVSGIPADAYDIVVGHKCANNRGTYQLFVNDAAQASYSQFRSGDPSYPSSVMGTACLLSETGATLRFTCLDAQSNGRYGWATDYLEFRKSGLYADFASDADTGAWNAALGGWSASVADGAEALTTLRTGESLLLSREVKELRAIGACIRQTNSGLVFGGTDADNFYHVRIAAGAVELYQKSGGTMTRLYRYADDAVSPSRWNVLEAYPTATEIRVVLNGQPIFTYAAPDIPTSGYWGIRSTSRNACFTSLYAR